MRFTFTARCVKPNGSVESVTGDVEASEDTTAPALNHLARAAVIPLLEVAVKVIEIVWDHLSGKC